MSRYAKREETAMKVEKKVIDGMPYVCVDGEVLPYRYNGELYRAAARSGFEGLGELVAAHGFERSPQRPC